MNYRKFGKEEILVSEVGLGTWQISSDWNNGAGQENAQDILSAAYEAGVNFYDTADVYGSGRSEQEIGKFIKSHTDIFVATKIGRRKDPGWPLNFKRDAIEKHIDDCLTRLGTEKLDLVQLHCIPTEVLRQGEVFTDLEKVKAKGKIRFFGASVESIDEARICANTPGISSLQIIFNVLRQKAAWELFDCAKNQGIAIIVRLPLASGLLSGKMSKNTSFSEQDHRNYNKNGDFFNVGETFSGLPFLEGVSIADELKKLVPRGMTVADLALRFILDFDAVTTIIPGASNALQPVRNAKVSDLLPLDETLHRQLKDFYLNRVEKHIRGKY